MELIFKCIFNVFLKYFLLQTVCLMLSSIIYYMMYLLG